MRHITAQFFLVVLLFAVCLGNACGAASLRLSVHSGNSTEKVSVLLAPFRSSSTLEHKIGMKCYGVILNDLQSSGVFDVDDRIPYGVSGIQEDLLGPGNSSTTASTSHDILITGSITEFSDSRLRISLFVVDVASGKQLLGKSFNFEISNWRNAAHSISGEIYERLTGDSIPFDSAVLYVAKSPTSQQVCVMDYDGANSTTIINGLTAVSSPVFFQNREKVVYAANYDGKGEMLIYDLKTGTSTSLGELEGTISSAQLYGDGGKVLISRVLNNSTDIYCLDIYGKQFTKLTNGESSNTSASFSRDGKRIVFNSDRSGVPHLYVMNSDGSNQRRISTGSGMYMSPSWSPKKDIIAFIKMKDGVHSIGILGADGAVEKVLFETTGLIDGLTWSPNGQALMIVQKPNISVSESKVYLVDLEGKSRKVIDIPADISSPHWSRLPRN